MNLLKIALVVLFVAIALPRLFYPGLHMDEGFYIGAAQRILHGDIFLRDYWFDKLFLGPFLIALGIAIAGPNPVGFHLMGMVCSIVSLFALLSWLKMVFGPRPHVKSIVIMVLLAIAIFIQPFMMLHHASAFTDPLLLMFLLLFGKNVYRASIVLKDAGTPYARHAYYYFAFATLCKTASPMWAPVLVGFWWLQSGWKYLIVEAKRFFFLTRYLWFVALLFTLTNPKKLAPFLWFQNLFDGSKEGSGQTLWARLEGWVGLFHNLFGPPWLSWGILAAALVTSIAAAADLRAKKHRPIDFVLIILPFWLHLLGIFISGARIYSRYLYILMPQLILVLGLGLKYWDAATYRRFIHPLGLIAALVLACGFVERVRSPANYDDLYVENLPSREIGRTIAQASDLPEGAVIHHPDLLWYLHPYVFGGAYKTSGNTTEHFVATQRGRVPFFEQYYLRSDPAQWYQVALKQCPGMPAEIGALREQIYAVDIHDLVSPAALASALHLRSQVKHWTIAPEACVGCAQDAPALSTPQDPCWLRWQSLAGAGLRINATLNVPGGLAWMEDLEVVGTLVAIKGTDARLNLGLRLEQISFGPWAPNLVDVAPLLFHGYLVPLGLLDLPTAANQVSGAVVDLRWADAQPKWVNLKVAHSL